MEGTEWFDKGELGGVGGRVHKEGGSSRSQEEEGAGWGQNFDCIILLTLIIVKQATQRVTIILPMVNIVLFKN